MLSVNVEAMAKRIVFVSTMQGFPWGGSEILWSRAARRALERGHKIATVTYEWDPSPEPIAQLAAAGATTWIDPRPRPDRAGLARRLARGVTRRLWPGAADPLSSVWRTVWNWQPDFVCVNQGSAYDGAFHPNLVRFLKESEVAYGLICQHNSEQTLLLS